MTKGRGRAATAPPPALEAGQSAVSRDSSVARRRQNTITSRFSTYAP
jgi:hypothetical protein